jgi:hypothetical protein
MTSTSVEQAFRPSSASQAGVPGNVHNIAGSRLGRFKNRQRNHISEDVPKPPDHLWMKRILNLDGRKRSQPKAHAVAPSSQGDTGRQEVPQTSTSQQPRIGHVGPVSTGVDIERMVGVENEPAIMSNGNGTTPIACVSSQRPITPPPQDTAQRPSFTDPNSQPLLRVPSTSSQHTPKVHPGTNPLSAEPSPTIFLRKPLTSSRHAAQSVPRTSSVPNEPFPSDLSIKQENDVAARLERAEKERYALRHVYMYLEHCMKDYERKIAALRIDMEDHKGSRRISVTCYAGAVDKAREIETILSNAGKGLQGFPFVVRRNKDTKIFGFKGPGSGRLHAGNVHYSFGNPYNTNNYRRKSGPSFSKTLYWTPDSTMVEILCAAWPDGNIAAAPIRMETERADESFATCSWTCGGIVRVGDANYGLTTAHPFLLGGSISPVTSSRGKEPLEDTDTSDDWFVDKDHSEGASDFFSIDEDPESYWQTIGKVSNYALAKIGSLPPNNDWLLFTLPKDRMVWTDFQNSTSKEGYSLTIFTAHGALGGNLLEGTPFLIIGNSPFEVLKIGLEEPLRKHIFRGDCVRTRLTICRYWRLWLLGNARGRTCWVIIAGSEEDPDNPVGYAINADEVYRNISRSMDGVPVRPLTATENDILALKVKTPDCQLDRLIALHVRLLFSATAHVGSIQPMRSRTLPEISDVQTGDAKLTALLQLGGLCSLLCSRLLTSSWPPFKFEPDPPKPKISQKEGLNVVHKLFRRSSKHDEPLERLGASMYRGLRQYKEGTDVILLISALLGSWQVPKVALILFEIMEGLKIFPLPTLDDMMDLVGFAHGQTRSNNSPRYRESLVVHGRPVMDTSFLAKSLARILYALHKDCFFVLTSVLATSLADWLSANYHNPVLFVAKDMETVGTAQFEPAGMDLARMNIAGDMRLPRIFLAKPGVHVDGKDVTLRFQNPYGEVVEYSELNELLMHLKAESELSEHRRMVMRMGSRY